jgi:hypothetical protein
MTLPSSKKQIPAALLNTRLGVQAGRFAAFKKKKRKKNGV